MLDEAKVVHVIPIGLEIDRVLAGLKQYPTNYAVFVYSSGPQQDLEQKAKANGKKIEKMINATVTVRNEYVDYNDFHITFNKLFEIFKSLKEKGYQIYLNLSSGSRIITSVALIVSFMTDATPYYIYPTKYTISKKTTVLSKGYDSILQLPSMSIETPSEHEKLILSALEKKGGKVEKQNDLIPVLEPLGFFPKQKEREDKRRYMARKRAKLNRDIINLSKRHFVILIKEGRSVNVSLTPSGELFSK